MNYTLTGNNEEEQTANTYIPETIKDIVLWKDVRRSQIIVFTGLSVSVLNRLGVSFCISNLSRLAIGMILYGGAKDSWNRCCKECDRISPIKLKIARKNIIPQGLTESIDRGLSKLTDTCNEILNWNQPSKTCKFLLLLWILPLVNKNLSMINPLREIGFLTALTLPVIYQRNKVIIDQLVARHLLSMLDELKMKCVEIFESIYPKLKQVAGSSPQAVFGSAAGILLIVAKIVFNSLSGSTVFPFSIVLVTLAREYISVGKVQQLVKDIISQYKYLEMTYKDVVVPIN